MNLRDHAAEHVGVEGLAVAGEEQRALAAVAGRGAGGLRRGSVRASEGAVADGDDAVLVAFALADLQGLALAVEVGEVERGEFAAAHAGAVEEFEHGAVADAERVADVGDVEDGSIWWRPRALGEAFFGAWHFEFAGGVGGDEVLFGEPGEVVLQGAEAAALGGDAERFAVGLAAAPEVALVAFEDGLGDRVGSCRSRSSGPQQEDFEGVAAALDGVGRVVAHGEVFEVARGFAGEGAGRAGGQVDGAVAAALVLGAVAQVFASRCMPFFPCHVVTTTVFSVPDVRFDKATRLGRKAVVPARARNFAMVATPTRWGEGALETRQVGVVGAGLRGFLRRSLARSIRPTW